MTIDELLKEEQQYRKVDRWLMLDRDITADDGTVVRVRLKNCGFHNQIFTVNGSVNYAEGHTINTVKAMHAHIRNTINNHKNLQMPQVR